MFTIFHARKDREPLTDEERDYLFDRIDKYFGGKLENAWLLRTDYRRLAWYWSPAMDTKNGVMGAADPMHDTVYLMPYQYREFAAAARRKLGGGTVDKDWINNLLPVAIHELRHVWQYRRSPLTYCLLSIPILREFTLERDAWKHTPKMEPAAGPISPTSPTGQTYIP